MQNALRRQSSLSRVPRVTRLALVNVLIAGLTFAVYARSCFYNSFVNYDDTIYVTGNPHVVFGLTADNVRWAWTTTYNGNWHPLNWMSLQFDAQLYELNPAGYHFTNVLLHAGSAVLLFLALMQATRALWPSALTALLFAVHPLNVESVAWVAERKGVLSTFFWMLTLWAYVGYAQHPRIWSYLPVFFAMLLGLLAKPMLVTLPFVLLLLDYWPLNRFRTLGFRRLLLEKVPFFCLALGFSVIAAVTQNQAGALRVLAGLPLGARLANSLVSYVRYLGMALWPANLAPLYPHPGERVLLWQIAASVGLLAAITWLALRGASRRPYFTVGWLWYLGTLVPVIGLVPVGLHGWADRYTYVPMVGVFLTLSWGLADFAQTRAVTGDPKLQPDGPNRLLGIRFIGVVTAAVVVLLSLYSWIQQGYWHDSVALWNHALQVNPENATAHVNLGEALFIQGNTAEAERHFTEALRIDPRDAFAHNNLGLILWRKGKLEAARDHFQEAIRINPRYAKALSNLGGLFLQEGNLTEARRHTEEAVLLMPEYPPAQQNLGKILVALGKPEEAESQFRGALRLDVQNAGLYFDLGTALGQQKKAAEALAAFREAVRLEPRKADYRCRLALALRRNGDAAGAESEYQEAFRLNPRWPESANRAAWELATHPSPGRRNPLLAVEIAEQVVDGAGKPDPRYLDTLAAAYAAAGRFSEAVTSARRALEFAQVEQQTGLAGEIRGRLGSYEKGRSFAQPPGGPGP